MKHGWIYAMGLMLLGMGAFGASPAPAATIAAGPSLATPSWDQQLECDTTADCPRFIVLSNWVDASHPTGGAAVLDRETGLVWEQSPATTAATWTNARFECTSRTVGRRQGWRLPSVPELASLVDPSHSFPALPTGHPFTNVQSNFYWSATTVADATTTAWSVSFSIAGEALAGSKPGAAFLWCVRGGMNADQY